MSGHLVLLAMTGAVIGAAFLLEPGPELVKVFGREIPPMCAFRVLFDLPCPGCGMTRSFVFLAHGEPLTAFRMNVLGPAMFAIVASQIPYRLLRLARMMRDKPALTPP